MPTIATVSSYSVLLPGMYSTSSSALAAASAMGCQWQRVHTNGADGVGRCVAPRSGRVTDLQRCLVFLTVFYQNCFPTQYAVHIMSIF